MVFTSLRKYGYRMDEDKKSRRRCLKLAIKEKGIKTVLRRLDFLLINKRYTTQTQKDIEYCLAKTLKNVKIDKTENDDDEKLDKLCAVCSSISEFQI